MTKCYQSQYIALTTKHHKEDVLAPPFRAHLGATLLVPWIDTDTLGTFSGEVERPGTALEVARSKARLGMEATGLPYGLASEGSFGPHPWLPFLPCDQEIILFVDEERGFTLQETLLSEETNYSQIAVGDLREAQHFLTIARFPSHAVIVRPHQWENKTVLFKGVQDDAELENAVAAACRASADGKAWLETDMRAHLNPTRRKIIGQLAERLAARLATPCPACGAPGWGRVRVEQGLPCSWCGGPTELVKAEIEGCVKCDYTVSKSRSDGLRETGPENCSRCNP